MARLIARPCSERGNAGSRAPSSLRWLARPSCKLSKPTGPRTAYVLDARAARPVPRNAQEHDFDASRDWQNLAVSQRLVDDGRRHSLVMIVTRLSQPESIRGNFAAPRPGYALKKPAVLAKEWAASTCGADQVSCETADDGMFLRLKTRCKDCKQHRCWSIVEKRRVSGGRTVQRLLEHVGLLRLIGRPPTK